MVQEKMDKLAETRIRTRKDAGVKFNKALAEKIRKEEEREKKRAERKAARKAAKAADDAMEVDHESAGEDEGENDQPEKATLLNDPRFKALFENPEFQVDETSREYALLNPSTVAQRQARGANGTGRRKTAVEDEEDESDKVSSDGISDDDSEDEDEHDSDSGSEDSDEAGGMNSLMSCDPRILTSLYRSWTQRNTCADCGRSNTT